MQFTSLKHKFELSFELQNPGDIKVNHISFFRQQHDFLHHYDAFTQT